MNLQKVQELAEQYGLTPSKGKGQNFLFNEEVIKEIVDAAEVDADSLVVEVGPGFGILTSELLKRVKKVLAVELDRNAIDFLKATYGSDSKFKLVEGDILKIKNQDLYDGLGGKYEVVANIPYNITSSIIRKFLSYDPKPEKITLLVQDEVAQRIAAEPGQMSILAVSVQVYADASYLLKVGKENFWPQPEVESAVIQITMTDKYIKKLKCTEDQFFQVVKFGFSAKRKKLANNLGAGMRIKPAEAAKFLEKLKFNVNARAQELSIEDWIKLANLITSSDKN